MDSWAPATDTSENRAAPCPQAQCSRSAVRTGPRSSTLRQSLAAGGAVRIRTLLQGVTLALVLALTVTTPAPARAADVFDWLRSFPGVVLVPPAGMEPFAALAPRSVEVSRRAATANAPVRERYMVQYRDAVNSNGTVRIGGTLGREVFEETLTTHATRSFTRCPADASYCVENVAGLDGAAPASEVFRGVTVGDSPAVVEHVVCCGGHFWSLSWYDSPRDMTYELVLVGPIADLYGGTIDAANVGTAAALAQLGGRLLPLQ